MLATTWQGKGWIQMAPSGLFVKPAALESSDVFVEDVAHHLSNLCRFTGGTRRFYSVAQHSVHVADALRALGYNDRMCMAGLLHDASEAYIGDFSGPLKMDDELGPAYKRIEARIMAAVELRFGIPAGWCHSATVKECDVEMLGTEAHWLMPAPGNCYIEPVARWRERELIAWSPRRAEEMFLARFGGLS